MKCWPMKNGVIRHYLTHWHESAPGAAVIQKRFSSALYCHSRSLGQISRFVEPDDTFTQQETHFGDFHLLPTPGHTPGSCSYLYHSPQGPTYLFVGDTLTRDHDRWVTVLVADSNPAELAASLELYRSLRPDVVLMSTTRGHLSWQRLHCPAGWPRLMRLSSTRWICGSRRCPQHSVFVR